MVILKGWQVFVTRTYAITTSLFTVISVIGVFVDARQWLKSPSDVWIVLIIVLAISSIISVIWTLCINRSIAVKINDKSVTLKYGDIFEGRGGIRVIAVNRCFDTTVDDEIIARSSLHGQFIIRYFGNSENKLRDMIFKALENVDFDDVGEVKPHGNHKRYPVGTIVPIRVADGTIYYLLALTEMNCDCKTHCTPEDYFKALCALIDYCNQHANGRWVEIPLIGSSELSRMAATKQDKLTAMLSVLMLKSREIACDISIVVGKRDRHNVSINRYE